MWRIGIVGFGNVGMGLARLLVQKESYLREKYGFEFQVVGIVDKSKGSVYSEKGLPLKEILEEVDLENRLRQDDDIDALELIERGNINVLIEAITTNLKTGEPSLTYLKRALEKRLHVVTTNKGAIVHGYTKLKEIALQNHVFFRFEGTVLSGTPSIALIRENLAGCEICWIKGILNGTTNFILTKMEEGLDFKTALKIAQAEGYVEEDPSMDIDGWDSAAKAVILANVAMDLSVRLEEVKIDGIGNVTLEDVERARKMGKRIKLLAEIFKQNQDVEIRVSPQEVSLNDPIAHVKGTTNALILQLDTLSPVMIAGPGAGRKETGQAVLSDLLWIHRITHSF